MQLYGGVWGGERKKLLNFGGNLDHHANCPHSPTHRPLSAHHCVLVSQGGLLFKQ